jgi:LmbE family N-acetylglucosaminyl deacetylase
MTTSRRDVLRSAVALAPGIAFGGPLRMFAEDQASSQQKTSKKLRVLVTGGHPGDPECGCGGTIARYAEMGHEVTLLYLNRGEGYCGERPISECGTVRTKEAERACEILKAHAEFAAQIDGQAVVDNAHYDEFQKLFDAQKADIVFTQWPIDSHRDHRALSSLVLDAWLKSGKAAALYYYEVAEDTMTFSPSMYVDITAVEARKRAACFAHASQSPEKWYPLQEQIARFRGTESGYREAEGFTRHAQSKGGLLP